MVHRPDQVDLESERSGRCRSRASVPRWCGNRTTRGLDVEEIAEMFQLDGADVRWALAYELSQRANAPRAA
jgi:hypothetical protein